MLLYHGTNRADTFTRKQLEAADIVLTTYSILEVDYRRNVMAPKATCSFCGKKFQPERLKVHLRYFCGPWAEKTEAQARQDKKRAPWMMRGGGSKVRPRPFPVDRMHPPMAVGRVPPRACVARSETLLRAAVSLTQELARSEDTGARVRWRVCQAGAEVHWCSDCGRGMAGCGSADFGLCGPVQGKGGKQVGAEKGKGSAGASTSAAAQAEAEAAEAEAAEAAVDDDEATEEDTEMQVLPDSRSPKMKTKSRARLATGKASAKRKAAAATAKGKGGGKQAKEAAAGGHCLLVSGSPGHVNLLGLYQGLPLHSWQ